MAGKSQTRMRTAWDGFARKDPRFFIATGGKQWDEDAFYASGRETVNRLIDWAGPDLARGRALEIGCGLGRLTRALADHFESVDGVDVSPEMIEQAQASQPPPQIRYHVAREASLADLPDGAFDLVLSHLVFQHIPDGGVICEYLKATARLLASAGCAVFQFDTRSLARGRGLYMRLPDVLLPRVHRRHIRRYPRAAEVVREWFDLSGLKINREYTPITAEHVFIVSRAG